MDDMKIEGLFGDRPEPSRPHHSHHHYDESSYRRTIGNYYIGAALGEGGFSKVFLGEDRETGERVALKILKQRNQISTSMVRQVEREINAMSALGTDCPYIIGLKDVLYNAVYTKKNGQKQESMLIALELATGGELFEFLSFTGAFEEKLARTYFVQLIKGLEHCHRNGIAHRDLKPENILLSGDFILKLADFGFSHSFSKSNMNAMVTQCGTAGYMAPEMLHRSRTRGKGGTRDMLTQLFISFPIIVIIRLLAADSIE